MVKYSKRPMSLRYSLLSDNNSPSKEDNLKFESIGILTGLAARKPVSSSNDKVYFYWHKEMPSLEQAISSPKKYLREPKSLSLNLLWIKDLTRCNVAELELAIMISSTYTRRATKVAPLPMMKRK